MKNIVYFFILLLELDNYLESHAEITKEIKLTFLNNNAKAVVDANHLLCSEKNPIDITLKINDDRIVDVKELELLTFCNYAHRWKITSPNTFKRFIKLTNLTIYGQIFAASDAANKERYLTQLFNVPTITFLRFLNCPIPRPEVWVLPPNLAHLDIYYYVIRINWGEVKKLKYLMFNTDTVSNFPIFGYPSLQELDMSQSVYIRFYMVPFASYCNLKKVIFNSNNTLTAWACNCKLFKEWLKFLEIEETPLTVIINDGDNFNNFSCNPCKLDVEKYLNDAKKVRVECLTLKPPEETTEATVIKNEFDSASWPFWIYIVAAFPITLITIYIIMRLAERVSALDENGQEEELEEEPEEE